jgi:hypothetical protein
MSDIQWYGKHRYVNGCQDNLVGHLLDILVGHLSDNFKSEVRQNSVSDLSV